MDALRKTSDFLVMPSDYQSRVWNQTKNTLRPYPERERGYGGCVLHRIEKRKSLVPFGTAVVGLFQKRSKWGISVPDQFSRIEEKLSKAWKFLTGEDRCFRFYEGPILLEGKETDRRIVLPLSLGKESHLAASVLLIDRENAECLAATMFGIGRNALREADVADACAEACNVLSVAIVEYLSENAPVEIGLPERMGAALYQAALSTGSVRAFSEGRQDKHQLMLVIFDPLIGPPPQALL